MVREMKKKRKVAEPMESDCENEDDWGDDSDDETEGEE